MLLKELSLPEGFHEKIDRLNSYRLYSSCIEIGLCGGQMARIIASFLNLTYPSSIDTDEIKLGVMPTRFCKKNLVVPINKGTEGHAFILSSPFNLEVLDMLQRSSGDTDPIQLMITEPENIELIIKYADSMFCEEDDPNQFLSAGNSELEHHPIVQIVNTILSKALRDRASDIHIQSLEKTVMIRFRVDGDLSKVLSVKKNIGIMLIPRFKAIAGLDIAEKRKPQDGALEMDLDGKKFNSGFLPRTPPREKVWSSACFNPILSPRTFQN